MTAGHLLETLETMGSSIVVFKCERKTLSTLNSIVREKHPSGMKIVYTFLGEGKLR
jgi:hypothetical protein